MSAENNKAQSLSRSISDFCKLVDDAIKDYDWNYDEVNRLDKLTQDYLHELELGDHDYKERAKIATQLAKCRQERRVCKDKVAELDPLVRFAESEKGRNLMNLLREVLGSTRKIESQTEKRVYIPRILGKEDETKGEERK